MTRQTIAYIISCDDNDSYMLGDETRSAKDSEERQFFDWRFIKDGGQHPATCPKCGSKIDPNYIDPEFQLERKRLDIGSTYDGYTIVSERFKRFCEAQSLNGISFATLPSQPKHFRLVVHNILEVDTANSLGIRYLYYCDLCNKYAGVFGPSGIRLKNIQSPIAWGIYRTDLEFAQAHEKSPIEIVGTDLAAALKAERFKGICLKKLEYK